MQKGEDQSPGDGAGPSSWESETDHFPCETLEQPKTNARDPATTPELCPEPNECDADTKKFFPLFRPKSQWKARSPAHANSSGVYSQACALHIAVLPLISGKIEIEAA